MAGSGSGTGGMRVFALRPLAVRLGFGVVVLLWAEVLPAQGVCGGNTGTPPGGGGGFRVKSLNIPGASPERSLRLN